MHPNEELARREMELIAAGDDEGIAALYAPDFVLHYPGDNPLAGTYNDVDEFLERLDHLFEEGPLSGNSMTLWALISTLSNCSVSPARPRD